MISKKRNSEKENEKSVIDKYIDKIEESKFEYQISISTTTTTKSKIENEEM